MKVIDTAKGGNDGFIEIETPGRLDTAAHCYDGLEELSGLRIRLFVHQSELALTTMRATKARSVTFPDGISAWRQTAHLQVGSEVSLAPGIALLPQGPPTLGRFLAGAGDFSLSIQMDDVEGTGPSYEAVVGPRKPAASETIHLPMGTQGLFLVVPAFDRRMLRGKAWATIRPRCLETRLPLPPGDRAARKQHPRGKPVDVGFLGLTNADARVGGASASAALPRVRSGATAYWPDGGMAGTVVEERRFFARAKASGARSCFLVAVRGGWPATEEPLDEYFLTLCFDPSDLVLHRGAQ
jgi:hypothetical protein